MSNRYLSALLQIEKAQKDRISVYEEGPSRFDTLVQGIGGQNMSVSDYLKIQQMFYNRYADRSRRQKDPQIQKQCTRAQMYIILQCQMLQASQKKRSLRRYFPHISFSDPIEPDLLLFVERKRPFYQVMNQQTQNRLVLICTILACFLLAFLVLVCRVPFWAGWAVSLAALLISVFYCYETILPSAIRDRIDVYFSRLDAGHQTFEKQMRHSRHSGS